MSLMPRSVVYELAAFEGKRILRHPLFWLGVLASMALAFSELMEEAPVLNRVSTTFAWTMAPIGAAVALLAGWAVLRARGRTDHPPAVMPSSTTLRVAGALVGLLWPAAATFGVQLLLVGWTYLQDPVTSVVWSELLVGPVFVVLAGGFAAAATRWLPHPSSPLFALLLLAGVHVVIPFGAGNWGEDIGPAALAPIAWPENFIPYEVAFRPSGLHLAYLLAVVLIVVAAATLGRPVAGWVILGVGMLAAGVLGSAQVGPIDEDRRTHAMSRLVGDEADLTCETHDSIIYCAMPGYEPWIDDWAGAVQPMLDSVPSEKITELEVRQYPIHNTFLFDGINTNNVFWWWVGPAYEDYVERDVVAVASTLADQTLSDLVLGVSRELIGCEPGCEGESRQVVIRWLISHDQQTRENLELQLGEEFGLPEVSECMVAELWEDSNADELVRSNWETLTAVDTSYEEAGEILGVEVPEYDENGRVQEGCL